MGGGASSVQGVEHLLTTTYMIGQAIAAITFPGMYRIYDFHSDRAPRLKALPTFSFFGNESDDEEDDDYIEPDSSQYAHFFHVKVGDDVIYIEDPLMVNEAGWTPLHSCCMSFSTVPAGLELINEIVKCGGNLNIKTLSGPGSFNSGWTPLHMAAAYGIEPLVERLVQEGADVNTMNSYGYTPLLEACHRGFMSIVSILIKGGADIDYIPPEELAHSSPFIGAPPQSALGEAARSGFFKIVQDLVNNGANKDLQNALGWTPLHEACFYNRIETAKMLLLNGANAGIRTRNGALPFHLSGLQYLRTMLTEMGGPEAVPAPGDEVDMVAVLKELTMSDAALVADANGNLHMIRFEGENEDENDSNKNTNNNNTATKRITAGSNSSNNNDNSSSNNSNSKNNSPIVNREAKVSPSKNKNIHSYDGDEKGSNAMLHSGGVLGDLPSLSGHRLSPTKNSIGEIDAALGGSTTSPLSRKSPSSKADDKKSAKKKKKRNQSDVPKDIPPQYLCQLTRRPMSEPVKTIYGHVYDKSAIMSWFTQQGHICPMTGVPLCETDLKPLEDLGNEIREWILKRSLQPSGDVPAENKDESNASAKSVAGGNGESNAAESDLYDF